MLRPVLGTNFYLPMNVDCAKKMKSASVSSAEEQISALFLKTEFYFPVEVFLKVPSIVPLLTSREQIMDSFHFGAIAAAAAAAAAAEPS